MQIHNDQDDSLAYGQSKSRSWLKGLARMAGNNRKAIRQKLLAALLILPAPAVWAALGASVAIPEGYSEPINPGAITYLRIILTNSDEGGPLNNVAFNKVLPGALPNGLKIAGAAINTCGGVLTAVNGTQSIQLSGGGIPAKAGTVDGSCYIDIPVTAGTSNGSASSYSFGFTDGQITGDGGVSNTGAVSQTIRVNEMPRPTIAKNFASSSIYLGGASTNLTFTVTNPAAVALANFSLVDNLPANIEAAGPASAINCTGAGAVNPTIDVLDTSKIAISGGTLGANGVCTITVPVKGKSTNGNHSWQQTNTLLANDFTSDIGLTPTENGTSQNITVVSPLAVSKTVDGASQITLSDGQSSSFVIRLTNNGIAPLTINNFTDDPIDGTTAGNANSYGLKVSGTPTATCSSGGTAGIYTATANNTGVIQTGSTTIAAGGYCDITIPFTGHVETPGTPDTRTNTLPAANITTTTPGVVSQAASASVIVADDLRVQKAVSPSSGGVAAGSAVQYRVTVQNFSTTPLSNVVITDTLTNGQRFITGTIDGVNYTPTVSPAGCGAVTEATGSTAAVPKLNIATLPARSSKTVPGACTVTFYAMAAVDGTVPSNVIPAGGVCYNNGAVCNGGASNSVTTPVRSEVATVNKGYNMVSPQPEGTIVRATITVTNWSANPLNMAIADNLPQATGGGQMRVANPANAATTCGGTSVIDATPGNTSVGLSGAIVPARASNGTGAAGTCNLQVDVIAGAGSYAGANANKAVVTYTEKRMDGSTSTGSAEDTADFVFNSSLGANKLFNPASVSSGGKSTVTVRLENTGAVALSNVSVTDPLPTGMVLANPSNAYTSCAGGTSITAMPGASSASMTGASLAGNSSCDFIFDVVATGSANWINTIPAGNITAEGGIRNQSAVSATLNYNAATGPTVGKNSLPSALTSPGQVSRLEVTINNGPTAVTNLTLTDYFTVDGTPGAALNGMIIAPTPAAATTCPGGIVTAAAGGASLSISGVTLAAGAACAMSVNVTSNKVDGITNYIPANSISTDQGLSNSAQAETSLSTSANLGVAKQFTPNVIKAGERSRLRITINNPTTKAIANLVVTDTLPAGLTVPTGANPFTTCSGATVSAAVPGQVVLSGGTLPAASSCYAEIDVTAVSQGDYQNIIPVGGLTGTVDGNPVTNPTPTEDTLHVKAPLNVHKAFSNLTLDVGNPATFTTGEDSKSPGAAFTLTVRLDNPNSVALTGAAFTDYLPDGMVVATTPNAVTTCAGGTVIAAPSATTVRLAGGTVPANGFCTVSVSVLSNIAGSYTNTIPAGGVTTTEGVSNEEPTNARVIISTPPTVGKQFDPAVIPPNGTSKLTIFLGNDNASAITLTSAFTDTLPTAPGNIVVANPANVGGTCPGTVTAAAESGTVTYANNATIPAGGCTIIVDVTGTSAGEHVNNIPAGTLKTNVGNNQQPANAPLTISTMGYVSGKVFRDNNVTPNGTFENGTDTPIAGEPIELRSGPNCSGTLVTQPGLTNPAMTDAQGNYLFSGLAAGTYSVCQPNQPAGTTNGTPTAGGIIPVNGSGGTAGTASNPTTTTSQVAGIVLTDNGSGSVSGSSDNNFAEIAPSSIAGTVFLDQNNNGVKNGTDAGIGGVTIDLLDAGGAVIATTVTDADGNYRFDNLAPGTYSVREPTQPDNTSNGKTVAGAVGNGGTPGTPTAESVTPSRISNIVLPPNTTSTGNNFAELPHGRTVTGQVFLDYNNNGAMDGSPEHGIGGQTVNLMGTDVNGNPVSRTTTTNPDGTYSFTGLPEGTYTVTQPNQPDGTSNGITTAGTTGGMASNPTATTSQIVNINLTGANTVSAGNNFAEIPGNSPDLTIAKTHAPITLGAGSTSGYYTLTPGNIGAVDTSGVVSIVDTLPAGITALGTPIGTGWTCSVAGQVVTCNTSVVIPAGGSGNPIILRVAVAAGTEGQVLINTATVSGGGEPPGFDGNNTTTDPTPIDAAAAVQGKVWLDSNSNRILDGGEKLMENWIVELLLNGTVVGTTTTDNQGAYAFTGLAPGSGYDIRFKEPGTQYVYGRPVPNEQGNGFTNGVVGTGNPAGADNSDGILKGLTLPAGTTTVEQSLPLDPSGVVYDAVTRQPVRGAVVTISGPGGFNAGHVLGGEITRTTGPDGFYQFLLLPGAPAGTYTLTVTAPGGYLPGPSSLIPACTDTLVVGAVPDPAAIQTGALQPGAGVPAHDPAACAGLTPAGQGTTQYYFTFDLTPGTSANVIHNHIPLDPVLAGAITIVKTTPLVNVVRGDLVPYTITATNTSGATLTNIDIADRLPPGFKYRSGSASVDGVRIEPEVNGRDLVWHNQTFTAGAPGNKKTYKLILVVGTGVGEGEYTNQAWAENALVHTLVSNIGSAAVKVTPDPTFDCSDIIGKVFDDKNANGYQDQGEPGIPNVRVVTARGLLVTTDAEGRFHVTCADIPNMDRGANFVMKLDERTLPSGYRVTTENPRDVRVTRGKMVKLNFGATVHRVVRLDLNDAAFAPGGTDLQPQWQQAFADMVKQLDGRPSVLRIAYDPGGSPGDGAKLAKKRLDSVAKAARKLWKDAHNNNKDEAAFPLIIETAVEGQP